MIRRIRSKAQNDKILGKRKLCVFTGLFSSVGMPFFVGAAVTFDAMVTAARATITASLIFSIEPNGADLSHLYLYRPLLKNMSVRHYGTYVWPHRALCIHAQVVLDARCIFSTYICTHTQQSRTGKSKFVQAHTLTLIRRLYVLLEKANTAASGNHRLKDNSFFLICMSI